MPTFTLKNNTVTLNYTDTLGEKRTREFFIPSSGGYVREFDEAQTYPQVCVRLNHRGETLNAATPDALLALVRSEWKASRVAENWDV